MWRCGAASKVLPRGVRPEDLNDAVGVESYVRLDPVKRERERERDVSATLTHLATGPYERPAIPNTHVPNGLTRTQPLFIRSGPLPNIPCKALDIDPEDRPKPDLFAVLLPRKHLVL